MLQSIASGYHSLLELLNYLEQLASHFNLSGFHNYYLYLYFTTMNFKNTNIPKQFYSYLSEKPIEHCIKCEKYLLDDRTIYFIEKAIKNNEVEFEYAICSDCAEKMKGTMSKESVANMENYFKENSNIKGYQEKLLHEEELEIEDFIENCIVTGTSLNDTEEYQLVGVFEGERIYPYAVPFAISMQATEEINEILSKETKDEMNGFIDDFIGIPPEWREIIKTNKPVLI